MKITGVFIRVEPVEVLAGNTLIAALRQAQFELRFWRVVDGGMAIEVLTSVDRVQEVQAMIKGFSLG